MQYKVRQTYQDSAIIVKGPAKWRVTVSGELRFMTSHLES